MRVRFVFIDVLLCGGWVAFGAITGLVLPTVISILYDLVSRREGSLANGILMLTVWFFTAPLGLIVGILKAEESRKRPDDHTASSRIK